MTGPEGDNGDPLTEDEAKAIRALQQVARHWPPTLMLVSMDGSLYVAHVGDKRLHDPDERVSKQAIIENIPGIPNDGGGW